MAHASSLGWLIAIALLGASGCGSSDNAASPRSDSGTDAPDDIVVIHHDASDAPYEAASDAGDGGPFAPAKHDPAPQVESAGGPVLSSPVIVPVFFPGDSMRTDVEGFLAALTTTTYWSAATGEYGVGPITVAPSVVATDAPPTTPQDLDNWITEHATAAAVVTPGDAGGDAATDGSTDGGAEGGVAEAGDAATGAWPVPTPNTLYVVYMPDGVKITDPQIGDSCVKYGGYHYEALLGGGKSVAYAIIPRCDHFGPLSGVDAITSTSSHELVEASTDPFVLSQPAYSVVDADHAIWNQVPLGEVGDMCTYEPQSFQPIVNQYVVQRIWSNASAAAGHDPCVPALNLTYFNAVPDQPDTLTAYLPNMGPVTTLGVNIAVGDSRTIDVHLFSDKPKASWSVQAQDAAEATGGTGTLSVLLDNNYGKNGDVLHLTITRNSQAIGGASEFMLWSEDQGYANLWFGFVGD